MHRTVVTSASALVALSALTLTNVGCTDSTAPTAPTAPTASTSKVDSNASPLVIDPVARARYEAGGDRFGVGPALEAQAVSTAVDDRSVVREAHRAGPLATSIAPPGVVALPAVAASKGGAQ